MKLTAYLAAAALALAPTTAFAGFVIIDLQTGPEVMTRAPVDAVAPTAAVPGTPSKQKDWYKAPTGTSADDALAQNQCWTSPNKVRKTAGTQGADGLCIWNNGTLSSVGTGGRAGTPGKPGSAYVPGLYETPYWGIEIPAGDHLFDHVHEREE